MKNKQLVLLFFVFCFYAANARTKNRNLIRNIDYLEATELNKYDWDDPAAAHMVLDNVDGVLTEAEVAGLKSYVLNAYLPTHNHMNYYFRKRMNSYMIEWLYAHDNDIALLNRAIEIARRAIAYRNDNISSVDDRFTSYKISYDQTIAPVWPNYKELEVYEDGTHGLAPGASGFAGVPMISVPVRMIAENKALWNNLYQGKSYYDIALELAEEAQKTLDYTYDVFVGEDELIRYPKTMQRSEWHGKVYIYNRVYPVMSGAIPLAEAYEIFGVHPEKIAKIDRVNQAMLNFLMEDMVFHEVNGKECVRFPYSDQAQATNPDQAEDFTHGSFDSRDYQLFFTSGRYDFPERIIKAMANTVVEVLDQGDGNFAARLNGQGTVKKGTPINFDGYIWYAAYRSEIYDIIIHHILQNNIAYRNGVYDAYCLFEILKLKTCQSKDAKLIYSNSFDDESALDDWIIEGAGEMSIQDGQLRLQSKYAIATQAYLKEGGKNLRAYVEKLMRKDIGADSIKAYYLNGKFQDAHFVCWNKFVTPENYIIEYNFKSLVNYPLHMIMFSHWGVNGKDVFSKSQKARNGIAAQYTKSDLVGYRISYFHPQRASSNLRKSPEQKILITGSDSTDEYPDKVHTLRVMKYKNKVSWEIDGQESFTYIETDETKVLNGGNFAFRLMNPAIGLYDNVKVYELQEYK